MRKTETQATTGGRLAARLSTQQRALFEQAAAVRGVTLTEFVVSSAQAEAERVLHEQATITLSHRDTLALIAALDEVRPITPTLADDLRDYARLVEQRP